MELAGSCHCQAVRFSVEAGAPVPFLHCYCSICRKIGGSGGFGINLGADFATLAVMGREHIKVYRSKIADATGLMVESPGERSFCGNCGSALWLWDPRWPELVHPYAGAIDTDLPEPTLRSHIMMTSKPGWVAADLREGDQVFDEYPDESLADWHKRMGL